MQVFPFLSVSAIFPTVGDILLQHKKKRSIIDVLIKSIDLASSVK